MPRPILYFKEVERVIFPPFITKELSAKHRDASNIMAEFTPTLHAYITSDDTAILQGAINTPAIWEQNLAALSESTTWTFKRDPSTRSPILVTACQIRAVD